MEIAYPFKIYKNIQEEVGLKEPLVHINTLAQICFRASSQAPDYPVPQLILLDESVVEGVNESGAFEIDFANNYLRKLEKINSVHSNEKGYRLGLFYEGESSNSLHPIAKHYEKAILLHGELKVTPQRKVFPSSTKDVIIQWITL
ncbi:hypothetical protein [Alkalicoccobacillus gibsonii]|uniref:hypothetical protein n=1 Tax=Alkalicoccobacillus gibsonii TaxID=79881 RepID=UPI0019317AB8|nr:hypothetical protein [Alkalicoccobacillus gibsonii]MBM0067917.1 hypothetical protein [Alkalicoccobacillus gibsonii]